MNPSTGPRAPSPSPEGPGTGPDTPIRIDVYSDLVCPWCFVGKRRLERALAGFPSPVDLVWHPFELNPGMPPGGMDRSDYRKAKFGSLERSRELEARVGEAGRSVDIPFQFGKIARIPNTFEGHRLLWRARRDGRQSELAEELFRAYFLEGRDLGDPAVLEEAAQRSGLRIGGFLKGPEGREEVRREEEEAFGLRVQGVPFFLFGGTVALSGAQPPEILREALERSRTPG